MWYIHLYYPWLLYWHRMDGLVQEYSALAVLVCFPVGDCFSDDISDDQYGISMLHVIIVI